MPFSSYIILLIFWNISITIFIFQATSPVPCRTSVCSGEQREKERSSFRYSSSASCKWTTWWHASWWLMGVNSISLFWISFLLPNCKHIFQFSIESHLFAERGITENINNTAWIKSSEHFYQLSQTLQIKVFFTTHILHLTSSRSWYNQLRVISSK